MGNQNYWAKLKKALQGKHCQMLNPKARGQRHLSGAQTCRVWDRMDDLEPMEESLAEERG